MPTQSQASNGHLYVKGDLSPNNMYGSYDRATGTSEKCFRVLFAYIRSLEYSQKAI